MRKLLRWMICLAVFPSTTVCAALPIQSWSTPGGARVLFVEAPTIPMLDIAISFDAGMRRDPEGKAGLAAMVQGLINKGTSQRNELQIAEGFGNLGAIQGGTLGVDQAGLTLRTLTSEPELSQALTLFTEVLTQPIFPTAVFERERQRTSQSLREAALKPATILDQTLLQKVYGGHPYGQSPTPESLAAILPSDIPAFYRRHYVENQAVIVLIGAIDRAQAEAVVRRLVQDLKPGEPLPKLPKAQGVQKAETVKVANPSSQTHIGLAALGVERRHPDYFPLMVGNYILGGGGFVSRLMTEVREKRGLAYSTYSYFTFPEFPGRFLINLQTQNDQADQALGVVRETLSKFLSEGPTDEELIQAKKNLLGGFALRLDSNRKIAEQLAGIATYGLPMDYLDTWSAQVEAVTVQEIRAAFKRNLSLDRMVTVMVGAQ